ncbi:MAG: DUF3883 domain-containing protein [Planctomycetes bacterium]|nr:DUF3883 domain-containing protein [Planctomycetota bacterium]
MGMRTSTLLTLGATYSRKELSQRFGITDATLNTGVFRPAGHDSVWLFITEEKTPDRTQYKDMLDGDDLHFEGQPSGRTDAIITNHASSGLELLLFYRTHKDERTDYSFRYEGPFEYVGSTVGKPDEKIPTRFHLRRSARTAAPVVLKVVNSVEQIRENLRRFARDAGTYLDSAALRDRRWKYWVYDPDTDQFGPSKFLAYESMTFPRYLRASEDQSTGARFDGAVARQVIEVVIGQFSPNATLGNSLMAWAARAIASNVLSGADTGEWSFVRLPSVRRYWALVCNPEVFDGLSAVASLETLAWTVDRGDFKVGDGIVLWQAKGDGDRRGVIALGDVESEPQVMPGPPGEQRFWRGEVAGPQSRIVFRLRRAPGLPLWEAEDSAFLSDLNAARARGGTVFKVEPDQWNEICRRAEMNIVAVPPQRIEREGGQGYGLTAAEKRAVEMHAQGIAENHFVELGYAVKDVSRYCSYDLHCTKGSEELRVEVKGTTGGGESVLLTAKEVLHARENAHCVALFIVANITLQRVPSSPPKAEGGTTRLIMPWSVSEGSLEPTQFRYFPTAAAITNE